MGQKSLSIFIFLLVFFVTSSVAEDRNLSARPLPQWFDEAKIGLFMHWGVYSVPSYGNEWYWHNLCSCPNHRGKGGCPLQSDVEAASQSTAGAKAASNLVGKESLCDFHDRVYGPSFSYSDFTPMFKAELFDTGHWMDVFKKSGAKYLVPTSKHHDGFCLWPCPGSWAWNSVDDGPHRDLIGEISAAVHNLSSDIHIAVYFSTFDWFNPLYLADKANGGNTTRYVDEVMWPQFKDLVERYKPDFIRMDGSWEMSTEYWKVEVLLDWLYTQSSVKDTIVVTDSWGKDNCQHQGTAQCLCKYGDSWTCGDKFTPGALMPHKWEHDTNIEKGSWGFDRSEDLSGYKTLGEILAELVPTIAYGGNFLINIGPTSDGRILPIFEERLGEMGNWLAVNGEAIYSSRPWNKTQKESSANLYFTTQPTSKRAQSGKEGLSAAVTLYAIFLEWPSSGSIHLDSVAPEDGAKVEMLGLAKTELKFTKAATGVDIELPSLSVNKLPCTDAWTLRLTDFS